jgi:cyclic 2,3-diphosphoglycerate synthetase
VTGHLARLLARDRDVVVVAMGRGGPAEPEVVEVAPALETCSRSPAQAATRVRPPRDGGLAGVPTIGCRRCGGGLAGATFTSTVPEGARLAAS